jgi:hypothetical protein
MQKKSYPYRRKTCRRDVNRSEILRPEKELNALGLQNKKKDNDKRDLPEEDLNI